MLTIIQIWFAIALCAILCRPNMICHEKHRSYRLSLVIFVFPLSVIVNTAIAIVMGVKTSIIWAIDSVNGKEPQGA